MTLSRFAALGGIVACVCVSLTIDGAAQARGGRSTAPGQAGRIGPPSPPPTPAPTIADDPFWPVVTDAPFSADATTTVTQVLGDGTRIEQRSTARFYRDSAGRVRREQTILGLDALNPSGEPRTATTIDPDPDDGLAYTLDPATRTARRMPRSAMASLSSLGELASALNLIVTRDGRDVAVAVTLPGDQLNAGRRVRTRALDAQTTGSKPVEESLGTRQIEGVSAVGRRTTSVIPTGQIGNDRPIEIVDERWESPDLRLLVRSLHRDPRTGDVEYRLTNILRVEPPPDLFMVPPGYTVEGQGTVGGRVGGPDTPGGRGGGQ